MNLVVCYYSELSNKTIQQEPLSLLQDKLSKLKKYRILFFFLIEGTNTVVIDGTQLSL